MPTISGKAKRIRIYLCQTDRSQRKAAYNLIIEKAKALDMAGSSVFRGIEGYGASCRVHAAKRFSLSCDNPVLVEIVDSEDYIAKLLPLLDDLISEGLVTIDDVNVIMYGSRRPRTLQG